MLAVRDLTKCYQTGADRREVLRGVSLEIASGELVAVSGPSGSGKSTLLNVVGTLDRADSGEIWLDDRPVHRLCEPELEALRRRSLGFVFQDFGLLPTLTAAENVEMALVATERLARRRRLRAYEALVAVGLAGLERRLPCELSGGEQQRVGIARAIVGRPRLVLADEPTANLDADSAQALIALMRRLATEARTAFLVATHDQRLLESAARRFSLRDGRLEG